VEIKEQHTYLPAYVGWSVYATDLFDLFWNDLFLETDGISPNGSEAT
jgi:hypothetical protein